MKIVPHQLYKEENVKVKESKARWEFEYELKYAFVKRETEIAWNFLELS